MTSIWKDVEYVKQIIASHTSRSDIISALGRSKSTQMYRQLKEFERIHEIDVSHLRSMYTQSRIDRSTNTRTWTDEELFCLNSTASISTIKRRIKAGKLIPYTCSKCANIGQWQNEQLNLQLEHIDGNPANNQLTNLCYLCPNCHSQTTTYCGRNVQHRKTTGNSDHRARMTTALVEKNAPLVSKVLASDIDFSVYGWSAKVAKLIDKNPQKIKEWMLRYMNDFYVANCYQRNER